MFEITLKKWWQQVVRLTSIPRQCFVSPRLSMYWLKHSTTKYPHSLVPLCLGIGTHTIGLISITAHCLNYVVCLLCKTIWVLNTSQIDLSCGYYDILEWNQNAMCNEVIIWKKNSGSSHCMDMFSNPFILWRFLVPH